MPSLRPSREPDRGYPPIIQGKAFAGARAVFLVQAMQVSFIHGKAARLVGLMLAACFGITGCQHIPAGEDADADDRPVNVPAHVIQPTGVFAAWQPRPMPTKRWADFEEITESGRQGLQVRADGTLSLLHLTLDPPRTDASRVNFSWLLDRELPEADLAQADISDSPVRLLLAFDGDRSQLSARNAMASELVRLLTGHELPYATLTYVWTRQYPPGTVLNNPRSDRIRYVVVEQGPGRLGQWLNYERDFRADFVRAFGEAPGPLSGVGLMTDTDNTKASTRVVYGPVQLLP